MTGIAKTGVEGLDAMLYGGIPEGNQVILAGGPGSGKSLLCFEYAYRNAKAGITSVFLAMEETPERMLENAKECFKDFTDIDELVRNRKLIIDGEDPTTILRGSDAGQGSQYEFGKVVSDIESIIVSTGAKRLVIDSLSVMDLLITDPSVYRRSMLALVSNLRRLGVTTILTAEMPTPERTKLEFKEEFFIFDGIIVMYAKGDEEKRALAMEVIKMRGAKHSFLTTPYEIGPDGFSIVSAEEIS